MYPSDHYFDTSQVPQGERVPQVGNPCPILNEPHQNFHDDVELKRVGEKDGQWVEKQGHLSCAKKLKKVLLGFEGKAFLNDENRYT